MLPNVANLNKESRYTHSGTDVRRTWAKSKVAAKTAVAQSEEPSVMNDPTSSKRCPRGGSGGRWLRAVRGAGIHFMAQPYAINGT